MHLKTCSLSFRLHIFKLFPGKEEGPPAQEVQDMQLLDSNWQWLRCHLQSTLAQEGKKLDTIPKKWQVKDKSRIWKEMAWGGGKVYLESKIPDWSLLDQDNCNG